MRTVEQESERKTKKARRAREMRDNPPRDPASGPSDINIPLVVPEHYEDRVEAFESIVEPE